MTTLLTMREQVWAIAMVIYCLVHRIERPEPIVYTKDAPPEDLEPEPLPLGPVPVSTVESGVDAHADQDLTEAGIFGHTDHSHARLSSVQPK